MASFLVRVGLVFLWFLWLTGVSGGLLLTLGVPAPRAPWLWVRVSTRDFLLSLHRYRFVRPLLDNSVIYTFTFLPSSFRICALAFCAPCVCTGLFMLLLLFHMACPSGNLHIPLLSCCLFYRNLPHALLLHVHHYIVYSPSTSLLHHAPLGHLVSLLLRVRFHFTWHGASRCINSWSCELQPGLVNANAVSSTYRLPA